MGIFFSVLLEQQHSIYNYLSSKIRFARADLVSRHRVAKDTISVRESCQRCVLLLRLSILRHAGHRSGARAADFRDGGVESCTPIIEDEASSIADGG